MKARALNYESRRAEAKPVGRMPHRLLDPAVGPDLRLCIPDDQLPHLPPFQSVTTVWPKGAPFPRVGEVIYLTSTSAWVVKIMIHEFVPGGALRHEAWLEWIGSARHGRVSEANSVH